MINKTVELVNAWAAFELNNPNAEIVDFCNYYLLESRKESEERVQDQFQSSVRDLGEVITRLYKFTQFYSKKGLEKTGLNSIEEFAYLGYIITMPSPTKSEIIHQHLNEFTTGVEILKRLINKKFITEFAHENDKRSKKLKATALGIQTFMQAINEMKAIGEIVFCLLSDEEMKIIYRLLKKLDEIHTEEFSVNKSRSLNQISAEMIKKRGLPRFTI